MFFESGPRARLQFSKPFLRENLRRTVRRNCVWNLNVVRLVVLEELHKNGTFIQNIIVLLVLSCRGVQKNKH